MDTNTNSSAAVNRILFVDDEENILRSLRRLFMDEECEVFTAPSGEEGLRVIKEAGEIGVIVSDQRMPGMLGGVDFLEQSRKISPQSIRILLTGYADINAAVDAINRGATFRYISKPWKDEDLLQTIKGALQSYNLIKENKRLNTIVKKQNEELKRWGGELEIMVQEQTMELKKNYETLRSLNAQLRTNFKSSIMAFAGLLELRDKRMRSHARNVAEIAGNVAHKLGMSPQEKETLLIASMLHDIGKIGISDIMLQLDYEDMDAQEKQEYQKHSIRGQAAVDSIENLRNVGAIIRHHHEHYDGSGFPDKIKRKDIPIGSRIIAIIDYVEKRLRKYQGADRLDITFNRVREESGKWFDPKLIPVIEVQARKFYKKYLPKGKVVEIELYPKDLAVGMILSRDVYSGTGILLLGKGSRLEKSNIMLLQRYHDLDPSRHGIFVTFKDEGADPSQ